MCVVVCVCVCVCVGRKLLEETLSDTTVSVEDLQERCVCVCVCVCVWSTQYMMYCII